MSLERSTHTNEAAESSVALLKGPQLGGVWRFVERGSGGGGLRIGASFSHPSWLWGPLLGDQSKNTVHRYLPVANSREPQFCQCLS
ncbi:hypothetical protein BaRGS_00028854 [Batillaria attramentaria]|uniref:Uncharacterized protein n=1 Tax=Batillaria attramentaria TaxID=370345 RepID=A0ABD0JYT9_9CAEN